MKEHYVSYECAKRLHELGFDGVDKYYVTENFCSGNNPISFDTYSVGDLVDEHIVYFVNENNEDDYRGIPAPRLDQAQAWLREVKNVIVCPFPERYKDYIVEGIYRERLSGWDYEIWVDEEEYSEPKFGYIESYEKALELGIDKALELLTNKF